MRRFQCAILATAAVGFASHAFAADMPVKAPVYKAPVAVAAYNWSGCYVGGNAGYGKSDSSAASVLGGSFLTAPLAAFYQANYPGSVSNGGSSFTGGGQLGCNWQISSIVLGIEGDVNSLNTNATSVVNQSATVFPGAVRSVSQSDGWFETLRGRLGVAFDRAFIYGTGGLAWGHSTSSAIYTGYALYSWSGASSDSNVGWTAGGGLEYALTNNWSIKGEYLYVDLGSRTYALANGPTNPIPGFTISANETDHFQVVRFGANYKFW
jgi:outer membrane immunogenic protein